MDFSILLLVFGVIFIAELPDKSMFASLALSTRFRKSYVWAGVATAFLVHVIIAVTAGHFLTLLPKHPLELIIGALFLAGALLLLFGKDEDESDERKKLKTEAASEKSGNFWRVFATSFTVVFLGEWGDITQIATANYAAKYHNAIWSVVAGATLGLWAVTAVGIFIGSRLLDRIPSRIVQRATGIVLLLFAGFSIWAGLQ